MFLNKQIRLVRFLSGQSNRFWPVPNAQILNSGSKFKKRVSYPKIIGGINYRILLSSAIKLKLKQNRACRKKSTRRKLQRGLILTMYSQREAKMNPSWTLIIWASCWGKISFKLGMDIFVKNLKFISWNYF